MASGLPFPHPGMCRHTVDVFIVYLSVLFQLVETLLLIRSLCQRGWDAHLVEEAVVYSDSDSDKVNRTVPNRINLVDIALGG